MKKQQNLENIRRAINLAGGASEVARCLGISSPWAVSKWAKQGIPVDRILPLLALGDYRFKPGEIDPEAYPDELFEFKKAQ